MTWTQKIGLNFWLYMDWEQMCYTCTLVEITKNPSALLIICFSINGSSEFSYTKLFGKVF